MGTYNSTYIGAFFIINGKKEIAEEKQYFGCPKCAHKNHEKYCPECGTENENIEVFTKRIITRPYEIFNYIINKSYYTDAERDNLIDNLITYEYGGNVIVPNTTDYGNFYDEYVVHEFDPRDGSEMKLKLEKDFSKFMDSAKNHGFYIKSVYGVNISAS